MVAGYRRSPRLLAALGTFARTHGDARFRREARRVNDEAFDVLRELLLSERALIARPAPEKAVSFAFLAATSVLRSVVYGEAHGGSPMTLDDPDLVAEMTALMLGYLSPGARRRAAGGRTKPRPERPSRSR
jgi:hypothetical protein